MRTKQILEGGLLEEEKKEPPKDHNPPKNFFAEEETKSKRSAHQEKKPGSQKSHKSKGAPFEPPGEGGVAPPAPPQRESMTPPRSGDNTGVSGIDNLMGEKPSLIQPVDTSNMVGQHSMVQLFQEEEWEGNDDAGFWIIEASEDNFEATCKELAEKHRFPAMAIKPTSPEEAKEDEERAAHARKLKEEAKKGEQGTGDDSAILLKNKKPPSSRKHDRADGAKKDAEAGVPGPTDESRKTETEEDAIATLLPKWVKF